MAHHLSLSTSNRDQYIAFYGSLTEVDSEIKSELSFLIYISFGRPVVCVHEGWGHEQRGGHNLIASFGETSWQEGVRTPQSNFCREVNILCREFLLKDPPSLGGALIPK